MPNGTVGMCAEGYEGPLCALCIAADEYYQDGECLSCPSPWVFALLAGGSMYVDLSRMYGLPKKTGVLR